MKTCTTCGRSHPATPKFFHLRNRSGDGLQPSCKPCRCEEMRERFQTFTPVQKATQLAHARAWYRRNRKRVIQKQAKYRLNNPRRKDYERAYYQAHREVYRLRGQRWFKRNKTRWYAYRKAWRAANLQAQRLRERAKTAKRRAIKRNTQTGQIDYAAIWRRDRRLCGICGRAVQRPNAHFDHIVPLARSGTHEARNIQVAHARCNLRKGGRLLSRTHSSRTR